MAFLPNFFHRESWGIRICLTEAYQVGNKSRLLSSLCALTHGLSHPLQAFKSRSPGYS